MTSSPLHTALTYIKCPLMELMRNVHWWDNSQLFGIWILSNGFYLSLWSLGSLLPVEPIELPAPVLSWVLPYITTLKIERSQAGLDILQELYHPVLMSLLYIPGCHHSWNLQNTEPNQAGSCYPLLHQGWVQGSEHKDVCWLKSKGWVGLGKPQGDRSG